MRRLLSGLLLPAVLLLGACTAGRKGAEASDLLLVHVQNNLVPPTALTVWVVPQAGGRRLLGSVGPGARRTFNFRSPTAAGQYQLQAETSEGRDLASPVFQLALTDEVAWDVRLNTLDLGPD